MAKLVCAANGELDGVMKRILVVTGAGSGIGCATAKHLTDAGHRVIGVDLREAEVIADLSTPAGREAMALHVADLAPDGIDGIVAAAGVATPLPVRTMVAVNYFGAIATLECLRPLLLKSSAPCAVVVTSSAALMEVDASLVEALLEGDEPSALDLASAMDAKGNGYASTKYALSRWLRAAAIGPDWAGSGILLNAVAPGAVRTAMTDAFFATEEGRAMMAQATPIALPSRIHGEADELAEVIAFLAMLRGRYLLGQIVYVDGGTEAIFRPDAI